MGWSNSNTSSGSGGGGSASASPIPPYDADPNDSPAQKFKKFSSRMNDDTLEGSFDPGPAPF
jgi:hypothetical protein